MLLNIYKAFWQPSSAVTVNKCMFPLIECLKQKIDIPTKPIPTKDMLRRTGMPGAVMVRMRTRQNDNKVSRNVNSNRRSTRSIPHITKHWARCSQRGDIELLYISRLLMHAHSCSCLATLMSSRELGEQKLRTVHAVTWWTLASSTLCHTFHDEHNKIRSRSQIKITFRISFGMQKATVCKELVKFLSLYPIIFKLILMFIKTWQVSRYLAQIILFYGV